LKLVADNLQITNRTIAQAVEQMNPEPIRYLVQQSLAAGAQMIDINSGPLPRDPELKMSFLVEAVQSVTDLPILLDTANPKALAAGLAAAKNEAIINGFSLEPAKLESILPLAKQFKADIIGYLLHPHGQVPREETERMSIAVALFSEIQNAGIDPHQLIIDPIIAPVLWENGHLQDAGILNVIRNLPDLLGFPVRTIAGISNLTTGGQGRLEKRLLLERTYLSMLAASGLSMALLNILHAETVKTAKAASLLLSTGIFTWEEIPSQ
jgi:5-methyltetrahydrofolate corrinoid/iron sulfur protein methyltransferase